MNAHVSASRYAHAALTRECAEVARTTSGRNVRINRAAFAAGGFVGAGHLDEGEVIRRLTEAAEACGYIAKDGRVAALDTIRSGLRRGILQPRDLPARDDRRPALPPDPEAVARQERAQEQQRLAREAEEQSRAEVVARLWREAAPDLRGTQQARYLVETRGLASDLVYEVSGHAIRPHDNCPYEGERVLAALCAFRDFSTNRVVGLTRIAIDRVTAEKRGRKMLGRTRGAAVKLSPDSEVGSGLVIAEGVETALAAMMIGWRPAWAVGSAGAIRTLTLLPNITSLSICAEFDDGGANAAAIEECGNRWSDAGREVLILAPKAGDDINAAILGATR